MKNTRFSSPKNSVLDSTMASTSKKIEHPKEHATEHPPIEHSTKTEEIQATESLKIGDINNLKVLRKIEYGLILDGGRLGDILLPKKYLVGLDPEPVANEYMDAFIAYDSEDRLVAMREAPILTVGQVGVLKVVSLSQYGAFLDWGIGKDLFLPFAEQLWEVQEGDDLVVAVYLDKSQRISATMKIEKYLSKSVEELKNGQVVQLIIFDKTKLGYKAVIAANGNSYKGMLYKNEVFQRIVYAQTLNGYIKTIREDGKIDISLTKTGHQGGEELIPQVLEALRQNAGFLSITDKTSPEEIYSRFGASKKKFKIAIGILYKTKKIMIEENGIRLL